ncbi:PrsW family intramembrane metalloprotease [Candidatus Parcubacteria bacterium]|nr:MAG: PrsW family intramembrane metalloprotease [Candidatus Parcubacteria bacterium]
MAQGLSASTLFLSLAGGFIPSLFWLWFWLKEDRQPEPKNLLIAVFIGGILMVPAAMAMEYLILYSGISASATLLAWAFIEEFVKFWIVKRIAFSNKAFDEPVDAIIYMITAALGFASLENTLFMIKTFNESGLLSSIGVGNTRFIGATLLHTASSAIIGAMIAFSFNKKSRRKMAFLGLIMAGALHFFFNKLILTSRDGNILRALIPIWLIVIALIFLMEKIKRRQTR